MFHDGPGPAWLGILLAAAEWGTPPWEIAGGSKLTWYVRWVEWKNLQAKRVQTER